ncbi:hypothetical protein KVT40_001812 [Elsinoe batatas]|uniref:Alcohol dehydrogenase iron-type/glycerol dehydrogenase GldA domain-containing protein n=1 Tax=Elsinoe batatas TaxID=2601811 RepID=A0A8K0PK39_9PEZI|nr:hypothetical protein KVT40_001812 [Elsinoe batatas]
MTATTPPFDLSGHWQPSSSLKHLYYGPDCVENHLVHNLPSPSSSLCAIITGQTLATQTPLVTRLQSLLGPHHILTISSIRQHGPESDLDTATTLLLSHPDLDTLISIGGGSPIDTAKVLSLRFQQTHGRPLFHISIPTTLSAAECTAGGGYTLPNGTKHGFHDPDMGVAAIFYDPVYAKYTPRQLFLTTGMRALDHAIEGAYHPSAAEMPWKVLGRWAIKELFECLPRLAKGMDDDEALTRCMLAAYASSGLKGEDVKGGMGLSHALGRALGSPYGIAHGVTSCLTLAKVVEMKAGYGGEQTKEIARLVEVVGGERKGGVEKDAKEVARRVEWLVEELGVEVGTLTERGVGREEVPVIVGRTLGPVKEGRVYEDVTRLVESLY